MSQTGDPKIVPNFGAVVLCGGKSSRLGIDKTQLIFRDQTFLERVVEQVGNVCDPVIVVGDIDFEFHTLPEKVLIDRDKAADKGPLEGIRVGLERLSEEVDYAFVTSCDVPMLQPNLIAHLFEQVGQYQAVVPFEGERLFGMTAVYRTELHNPIRKRIEANELRVSDLAGAFKSNLVDVKSLTSIDPALDSMTNINSAEDYWTLLNRFGLNCPKELLKRINSE